MQATQARFKPGAIGMAQGQAGRIVKVYTNGYLFDSLTGARFTVRDEEFESLLPREDTKLASSRALHIQAGHTLSQEYPDKVAQLKIDAGREDSNA